MAMWLFITLYYRVKPIDQLILKGIGILIFPGIIEIEDVILCLPAIFHFQSAMPYPASS